MKIGIEQKRKMAEKDILVNENSIKAENVDIYYENNRLSHVYIDGKFDHETIKEIIDKYPDSKWASFVLDNGIDISSFKFFGDPKNHEEVYKTTMELIKKLNIVKYLDITERNELGSVTIETTTPKYQVGTERINMDYVLDTIEKVELVSVYRNETKKAVTEVLGIPNLDKISPQILRLSLKGKITKGIDQQLVDIINTLNQPFSLECNNERCIYSPNTPNKFLYFKNKIYPLSIDMKETYPKLVNFFPEEIRKVLDKCSGYDTTIFFVSPTKKDYEKVLSKALAVLSKLKPPVPEYLSFDKEVFQTRGIVIRGTYEKLDVNLNLLFQPEGKILLPLRMFVYSPTRKVLSIYKSTQFSDQTKSLIKTLKNFLGTEAISEYSEESQKRENDNISYYLLTYGNYYIVTNREFLPTVIYKLSEFAK